MKKAVREKCECLSDTLTVATYIVFCEMETGGEGATGPKVGRCDLCCSDAKGLKGKKHYQHDREHASVTSMWSLLNVSWGGWRILTTSGSWV